MNKSEKVEVSLNMIGSAFRDFGSQLNHSGLWLETGQPISTTYSTMRVDFTFRDNTRKHGLILPQTPVNQEDIRSGKIDAKVSVFPSINGNSPLFEIHYHQGIHPYLHIQNGNKREEIQCGSFGNLAEAGSNLFLATQDTNQIKEAALRVTR